MSISTIYFYYLVAFVFGALVGNFATTLLYRIPRQLPLHGFGGVNTCPPICSICLTPLRFYEFLPILSLISTMGRCNYCNTKIDYTYALLEISVGITSVYLYSCFEFTDLYIIYLFALSILLLQTILYLQYKELENALAYATMVLGIVYKTLLYQTISDCVVTMCIGGGISMILHKSSIQKPKADIITPLVLQASSWTTPYILVIYSSLLYCCLYYKISNIYPCGTAVLIALVLCSILLDSR